MQNPALRAFFLGRALAEVLTEKVEDTLTNALSEFGKFEAEQRENLRQLLTDVERRAAQGAEQGAQGVGSTPGTAQMDDLQETLDQLRAEMASLKAELKTYRESNPA
ncbi:MAG: hypothetical protein GC158_13995 [Cyanobacteria bacterium RI_101]|nr:hypothetical protein [Cyanobacteria bacterium RI_101]